MSIYVQTDVWKHSKATGNTLLVLLALADNADADARLAWPSMSDLATRARCDERTAQRHLRKLEEWGEIVKVRTGGTFQGQRRATVYRVLVGSADARDLDNASDQDPGDNLSPGPPRQIVTGDSAVTGPGDNGVTLTVIREPSSSGSAGAEQLGLEGDGDRAQVQPLRIPKEVGRIRVSSGEHESTDAILAAFSVAAASEFTAREWREKIIRRLRERPEVTLEKHLAVIAKNFANPWWEGPATPSVIYGSGAQFERALLCDGKPKVARTRRSYERPAEEGRWRVGRKQ